MSTVKLIYFEGCPNAGKARENLRKAGLRFEIVCQDDLPAGDPLKSYSSPTILRDDEVVFGAKTGPQSAGCSLAVPTAEEIRVKLGSGVGATQGKRKKSGLLATVGSVGSVASALTVGLCPVCIPALGGFLSAIGLGFLVTESVLQPLLVAFLIVTVGGLAWSYKKVHGKITPLLLGVVMSVGLYVSRYVYLGSAINPVLMYGSITGIIAVSLWNLWLRKKTSCPSCVDGEPERGGEIQ